MGWLIYQCGALLLLNQSTDDEGTKLLSPKGTGYIKQFPLLKGPL